MGAGSRLGLRAAQIQSGQYHFKHGAGFLKNLIIPEADDLKSASFYFMAATLVVGTAFLVLASVELDYKFSVEASEIGDVASDDNLPAKSMAVELTAPQVLPQMTLRISGLGSQNPAVFLCDGITHWMFFTACLR